LLPRKASKEHDLAYWGKTFREIGHTSMHGKLAGEISQWMKILLGENMVK